MVGLNTAGWRLSLVDVLGEPALVIWLCGCPLCCPYCHNWKVAEADRSMCKTIDVGIVVKDMKAAARLATAFMATGGEPLLQARQLEPLLEEATRLKLQRWINTSLYPHKPLEKLAAEGLVDAVATDIKVPPEHLTGLPPDKAQDYWDSLIQGLRIAAEYRLQVEVRIPVPQSIPDYINTLQEALAQVAETLQATKWRIIVDPLQGPPRLDVRNPEWCRKHCNPPRSLVMQVAHLARKYAKAVRTIAY